MPQSAAPRVSERRRLPGASLLLALPALLLSWRPGLAVRFQLDPRAVAAGEVWRLLTGHWVHWSKGHLLWDLAAFLGLAAACELQPGGRRRMLLGVGLAAVAIPAALFWLFPGMLFYRGLSGIDAALFVLLVVPFCREDLEAGRRGWAASELLLLALFLGKCGYEAATGQAFFLSDRSFVPVPLAHLVGGFAGLAVALTSVLVPVRP